MDKDEMFEAYVKTARKTFKGLEDAEPLEAGDSRGSEGMYISRMWANKNDLSEFYEVRGEVDNKGKVKFTDFEHRRGGLKMNYDEVMDKMKVLAEGIGYKDAKLYDISFTAGMKTVFVTAYFKGKPYTYETGDWGHPTSRTTVTDDTYEVLIGSDGTAYAGEPPRYELFS